MVRRLAWRATALILAGALLFPALAPARAQPTGEKISFIRDAEIENTVRIYATPIFEAAGFNPADIDVFLVNDNRLNAFVAGGLNLFLNTGLLVRADTPEQVIGVIAHETGHIVGGHLARLEEAFRDATKHGWLQYVLAAAAAVATKNGNAATAVMSGGSQLTQATLLKFNRAQESSADQAGLTYLDDAGISAVGLRDFFAILRDQELLVVARQDPYIRTHPLTEERIQSVEAHIKKSPFSDKKLGPEYDEMQARMRGKLRGFLDPVGRVMRQYPESDTSLEARYARAIAYYRKPDLVRALPLIDGLIAEHPRDPYFHELRGQMLFENGRIVESIPSYIQAVDLLPNNGLLRTELAHAMLETGEPSFTAPAIEHLEQSRRLDSRIPLALRLLAVGYGRQQDFGMSARYSAEFALRTGKIDDAIGQAEKAIRLLPAGSVGRRHAEDIKQEAENIRKG